MGEQVKDLNYYKSLDYPITIFKDEDGYFVKIEDLEGCMSDGDTIEEALTNINESKNAWLEVSFELGFSIPEPSGTLSKDSPHRVLLQLDDETFTSICKKRKELNFEDFIHEAIKEKLNKQ